MARLHWPPSEMRGQNLELDICELQALVPRKQTGSQVDFALSSMGLL